MKMKSELATCNDFYRGTEWITETQNSETEMHFWKRNALLKQTDRQTNIFIMVNTALRSMQRGEQEVQLSQRDRATDCCVGTRLQLKYN